MSYCKVCSKPHSQYVMNNKPVCFHCDELMFDIEIEEEDFDQPQEKTPGKERTVSVSPTKRTKTTTSK